MDINDTNALQLTHRFAAPPPVVFAIWTTPALIRSWFGSSHGFRATDIRVDLRPGGNWSLTNVKGGIVELVSGTYHEVVADRRVCYSYHFEGTDFFSVISVDFAPDGDGTRIAFLQTGFPDATARVEHARGWPHALKVMGDAVLAFAGAGTVWPLPMGMTTDRKPVDRLAEDLEAARQRHFADTPKP